MGTNSEPDFLWRSVKGIYFPNRHPVFQLDGKAFLHEPLPALPSAKTSAQVLEQGRKLGSPEYTAELRKEAENGTRVEQTGEYNDEDLEIALYGIRRLMDRFLLCRKKNPRALADLAANLDYGLTQLYLAAKKERNRAAAAHFSILLGKHVERLRELAFAKPQLFEALAQQLPTFPVPGSRFKEQQVANDRLIKEVLVVGKNFWRQQRRKTRESPSAKPQRAKKIAADLIDYLEKYRIVYPVLSDITNDLPPWTRKLRGLKRLPSQNCEVREDWFKLAWDVVLETTNGQPAEVDDYWVLARRRRRTGSDGRTVADAHSSIKYALRNAFRELATGKHPRSSQKRE